MTQMTIYPLKLKAEARDKPLNLPTVAITAGSADAAECSDWLGHICRVPIVVLPQAVSMGAIRPEKCKRKCIFTTKSQREEIQSR